MNIRKDGSTDIVEYPVQKLLATIFFNASTSAIYQWFMVINISMIGTLKIMSYIGAHKKINAIITAFIQYIVLH